MVKLIVGLAGNPNVGKTTVFNKLTGMHQHVGNWPGKTVEQAKGHFSHGNYDYDIIDLPGNYALSAHSIEEIVSRDFIVDDDSDVIINVVDATNLERNLYLTVQMMELGANLVLALNMNDFAKKKGHIIDIDLMSELLGFPVVEINAKTGDGFDELFEIVEKQAENPVDSSVKLAYGAELKGHLEDMQALIEKDDGLLNVPSVWTAIKLLEKDSIVIDKVQKSPQSSEIFIESDKVSRHLYDIYKESVEEVVANARYAFIDGLMAEAVERPAVETETITDKIDNIVTNRILAIPIFLLMMYL
ncbi:MAG: ferrous iron transporter B, partial [Methanobrevibacter sp.]|nr:ferrous iron transporter B [Methanobrevibacter sp.]